MCALVKCIIEWLSNLKWVIKLNIITSSEREEEAGHQSTPEVPLFARNRQGYIYEEAGTSDPSINVDLPGE